MTKAVVNKLKAVAVSLFDLLLPYQQAWVRDKSRFKIWLASRQVGKSFAAAFEAVEECILVAGTVWIILSAGERQALDFMLKAKQLVEAYQVAALDYVEDRDGPQAELKSAEIVFPNGSRMKCLPANPDTCRGLSGNVILDEFAFHQKSVEIWRAIFPTIANPLKGTFKLRIISTANGKQNKFFQLWDQLNNYSKHKTTIHDAIAQGLPVDLEELKANLDDPEGWDQEFECEFLDGADSLLTSELVKGAESLDADIASDWMNKPGTYWGGIDFGRSIDPTVFWCLESVADLLITREVLVLKNTSTPDQNKILGPRIKKTQRTSVDYTGPGIGFGDYACKDAGLYDPKSQRFGKVELCTFTSAFKREIFPRLRRCFEAVRVRVPVNTEVREDLLSMQLTIRNGIYTYWAKRGKEGHSDRCTALALAVRARGEGKIVGLFQQVWDKVTKTLANKRVRSITT